MSDYNSLFSSIGNVLYFFQEFFSKLATTLEVIMVLREFILGELN